MMHDYRTAAPRVADPDMLPDGPATKCPACNAEALNEYEDSVDGDNKLVRTIVGRHKSSQLTAPKACSPSRRISISFFRRCKTPGEHLHESCTNCGHNWLTRFGGAS